MYARIGITAVIALFATTALTGDVFDVQTTAQAPASIPSTIMPPTVESMAIFTHKGETLAVGLKTGRVTILGGNTTILPDPVRPNPQPQPTVNLTGNAKIVYDSLMQSVNDPQKRREGAIAMIAAIDSTVSQAGGLGLQGQGIVNAFAANCSSNQVNDLLKGWAFGDVLQGLGIQTDEQFLKALEDVKTAMGAIR